MIGLKIKHLINCVGLGWGESGRVPKLGPEVGAGLAVVWGLAQRASVGFFACFCQRSIAEL